MQGDNRNVAKGDAAAVVIDMLPETSSKTTAKDEIETTDEIAEGASSSLHLNVDALARARKLTCPLRGFLRLVNCC